MSNNPFRQARDESALQGNVVHERVATIGEVTKTNGPEDKNGVTSEAKREVVSTRVAAANGVNVDWNGNAPKFESISEDHEHQNLHADAEDPVGPHTGIPNGVHSQDVSNGFVVQSPTEQSVSTATSNGLYAQADDDNVNWLSGAVQGIQINQLPQDETQRGHAHVPSFSHIRKESLPYSRPTYVRALSSQVTEAQATRFAPEEARAEVIRRLGKVDRSSKTLKRRGSNESLSSLISYSIRRPSIPARPESGYSLDALASVLEDVAQEGNLALVEATMALGANPNFRSVNRLKNRRHDALNKATAAGHVEVIDYLLKQGATFASNESLKKETISPLDLKLLDVAYSGYSEVARYFISKHNANPFIEQWPREYFDANRTIYRRVNPVKVHQRTVLDALARMGDPSQDMPLLQEIMSLPSFVPTAICTCIYADTPYQGDGSRMMQSTYYYSVLSAFTKAGWSDAVEHMLTLQSNPSAYEISEKVSMEEGQIPSANIQRHIYPANALTKDTWLYQPTAALRILESLIKHGFDIQTAQRTPDDSAPRTPLARAVLSNAAGAVDMILQSNPALVHDDMSFRLLLNGSKEAEYKSQPLAAAIILDSLDSARVVLRHGAGPGDHAIGGYKNVLCFAAGHGGGTTTAILADLLALTPELEAVRDAVEIAIKKVRPEGLSALLGSRVVREGGLDGVGLWDLVLGVREVERDGEFMERYERVIELIYEAHGKSASEGETVRPSEDAVKMALAEGNKVGVGKLVELGIIDREMLDR